MENDRVNPNKKRLFNNRLGLALLGSVSNRVTENMSVERWRKMKCEENDLTIINDMMKCRTQSQPAIGSCFYHVYAD